MDWTPISLGLQSNPGRDAQAGDTRLINCYVESAGNEGKTQAPVYACDGYRAFCTLAAAGVSAPRAALALSDTALYVVAGTRLVKINAAGVETAIGGTLPASGLVTMARNRREPNAQIGISVGGQFWVCENDVLTQVNLAPLGSTALVSVTALDGYFVLFFDNGEVFSSDIDASTIDPLDFTKAESSPDGGVVSKSRGRELVLFGSASTEWYTNAGGANFPFERTSTSGFGCYAAGSAVNVLHIGQTVVDTIAFAATDALGAYAGICILDGYGATKISTPEVDRSIASEPDRSAIKAFCYSRDGHTFYTVSTSTATWSYDHATGLWHERQSSGATTWNAAIAVTFGSKIIVGHRTLAKLFEIAGGLFAANADSVLTLKHANDVEVGWNATRTAAIGGVGQTDTQVRFNRLGQSREDGKQFEVSISNAVMEDGVGNDMVVRPPIVHAYPKPVRFFAVRIDIVSGASRTDRQKGILGMSTLHRVMA